MWGTFITQLPQKKQVSSSKVTRVKIRSYLIRRCEVKGPSDWHVLQEAPHPLDDGTSPDAAPLGQEGSNIGDISNSLLHCRYWHFEYYQTQKRFGELSSRPGFDPPHLQPPTPPTTTRASWKRLHDPSDPSDPSDPGCRISRDTKWMENVNPVIWSRMTFWNHCCQHLLVYIFIDWLFQQYVDYKLWVFIVTYYCLLWL